jgi:hypothetical protein
VSGCNEQKPWAKPAQQLFAALRAELDREVLPVARRSPAQIDDDVEDPSAQRPDQLGLGKRRDLEMQAAHRSLGARARLVVLDEFVRDAGGDELAPRVGLGEVSARVGDARGADEPHAGKRQRTDVQFHCTRCPATDRTAPGAPAGVLPRSAATTCRVRSRQPVARKPNVAAKRAQSSSELAGRLAGAPNCAVVIGTTVGK